jgi:predicted GNAT family N-acyltransferase
MMIITSFSMNNEPCQVEQVSWQEKEAILKHIRTVVFLEEQHVPEELEWDDEDKVCVHVLAKVNDEYIATGRLLDSGQIGRMAVLKPYRKKGVGSAMLKKILFIAELNNMNSVFLNAQVDAVDFYKKFGFIEEGDVFDDAGIPHLKMTKQL